MDEQTLWIARSDGDTDYYLIFAKEPQRRKKKGKYMDSWHRYNFLCSVGVLTLLRCIPESKNLKLEPSEKKQFTISIKD